MQHNFDPNREEPASAVLAELHDNALIDTDLFAGITRQLAHDIRNVLGCVGGFVTLLERDLQDDTASLRLLQKIKSGTERLGKTSDDLSLFANPHSPILVKVDFNEAMKQALYPYRSLLPNKSADKSGTSDNWSETLTLTLLHENVHVLLDMEFFSRMIELTVVNMMKYLTEGTEIRIAAQLMNHTNVRTTISTFAGQHSNGAHPGRHSQQPNLQQRPFTLAVISKILRMLNGHLDPDALANDTMGIAFSLPISR